MVKSRLVELFEDEGTKQTTLRIPESVYDEFVWILGELNSRKKGKKISFNDAVVKLIREEIKAYKELNEWNKKK